MKKNSSPSRTSWYTLVFLHCFFAAMPVMVLQAQQKTLPNIVYILADDMGYGDVSANNAASKIATPNIDRLAGEGMRFTDAHTTSSVCTPSRYSILTGRYPWRSRLPVGVLRGYSRTLIDEGQPTVATLLKTNAYRTGVVGKWHLGLDWVPKEAYKDSIKPAFNKDRLYGITQEMNPDHIDFSEAPVGGPTTQGFDYSYILPASLDMPPYCYLENDRLTASLTAHTNGNKLESGYTGPFWRAGLMSPSFDFYDVLPAFTRKANDFIRKQDGSNNPFFLYFPMPAPHTPWVPAEHFRGKSQAGEYGDYVQQVDDAVGQILHTLDSMGIAGNTLVIFSSDNGPYWRENFVEMFQHHAAGPFRGMKGDAFEGGHRVPFIVRYPGRVNAGSVCNATITLASLMATCVELVGETSGKFETEDSYSILPVLTGKAASVAEQPAIVNISSRGVYDIRKGDWKLITQLGSGGFTVPAVVEPTPGGPVAQLYHLAADIHEDNNLYSQHPEKVKELTELLEKIKNAEKGKRFTIDVFQQAYIKETLLKVAHWQLNHSNNKPENTWTNAAFYTGVFAAYGITQSKPLLDSMMAIGERNQWRPASRYDHADDIAISQTYIDLYRMRKKKRMLRPTIDTVNKMSRVPGNEIKKHGITWWWCDALFMAPPTLAKLSKTLKDPSYLVLADTLFRQTYQLLYNHEEKLFARDASYLWTVGGTNKMEANGKKIFWSRGNGWVMAGLVRLLEEMPQDYPDRSFYVDLFKEMANRLVSLQQANGLWRSSLLDPEAFPGGEGSGSGFNCYAFAWGLNQKILDPEKFLPAVKKAWEGLNTLIKDDGKFGWVQPIGADPRRNFNEDSWESYGAGALLLAGSEVYKLNR